MDKDNKSTPSVLQGTKALSLNYCPRLELCLYFPPTTCISRGSCPQESAAFFGPLLTRKSLALLVLLATAVSPVQALQSDSLVCNRTQQVQDEIVIAVRGEDEDVSDCNDITDEHLAGIGVLSLSGSSIKTLQEDDFAGLTALRSLYLNNNGLTELPMGVFAGLTALEDLYLEHNSLTELPLGVFAGLTALDDLYLEHNRLTELPLGVFADLPLEGLYLNDNSLAELPLGVFADLPLAYLYLDNNNLMELSADIFSGLPSLQALRLSGNSLTALPEGVFAGLTALSSLYLNDNGLTELPMGVFAGLTALSSLYLNDNGLKELPLGVFAGLTVLRSLYLNDNGLTELPMGVFADLTALEELYLDHNSLTELSLGIFAGLPLEGLYLHDNSLVELPLGVFADLPLAFLYLDNNNLMELSADIFSGLPNLQALRLSGNSLTALPEGVFSGLTALVLLNLSDNSLEGLPAGAFSGLTVLVLLNLRNNSLTALPGGVFSSLTALNILLLDGNPGIEGFRPIANAGADQTAGAGQVVTLTATASDDPWGDNVRYVWTRIDNSGSDLTLMDAETASPSFVMPAGATGLEFELRVIGSGGDLSGTDHFVGTDRLKVRHPDAVVTLTGPEPMATTDIVGGSISLVYTYSAADLHGRVLAGKIEVTAAVDGVAVTPTININGARGEITIVLDWEAYPHPDGHLLAVTLGLGAAADGFVLGEPSSIATPFSFVVLADPSVCDRTPQVRDAIVALVPVSHCADVTNIHLAGIDVLNLAGSSIETLQEGDFAGITNLLQILLSDNRLEALPAGAFSALPALRFLDLSENRLEALPAGVFSELPTLRFLDLSDNRLEALPAGAFSALTALNILLLDGNPGSEGFRPIADAGADQTAVVAQVVTLTATASDDDPWGDNVRYVWTRTDNSGSELTLMDAETANPSFVMPAGATGLEFELRVTGRGANPDVNHVNHFVGTDSLKVRHPDAVVTLTGPEPMATMDIVADSIRLVYTYSAADLHGRVLAGKIEVTAAVDGVAVTPTININGARGEITIVLDWEAYPHPDGHLLAVTLSLGAAADGFVLREPSSITTPFRFVVLADPSVCDRTPQVRDAIVALVSVSHCADVTNIHLAGISVLDLSGSSIVTLQEGDFAGLTNLLQILLSDNRLEALPAGVFSELPTLRFLYLDDNSLTALPAGVFSGLTALETLELDGNPGSEGFRPIANAGADQTAVAGHTVTLTATASDADPWGDNVRYAWRRTDNSGNDLTLMDAETASLSFVMPTGATGLEFELRVTGRGGDHFVGTDSLKVRHPDTVVTLTGPVPAATTDIGGDSINLVYTYSAADLHGRVLAGKIEVAAAIDGVAITPDINIDEARGQGEITVVLRRQEYPGPIGRLLAVTLSLSATAEGFVLGEPSSMTTTFSFFSSVDPSVCARTEQVRDAIVALVPVSHCAYVTDVHLAGINILDLSESSIVTLQEGDFAGLTNLLRLLLSDNRLEALPAGAFSGLTVLFFLDLNNNRLEALPAGVFSELLALSILYLDDNSLTALPAGVFSGLTYLFTLSLHNNDLMELSADVFSGLPRLLHLVLAENSLTDLPGGVFSDLTGLEILELDGNPGSEGFRPIANAGADQSAGVDQVVTLMATASGDDPWGDNVRYVWTRIDNSGSSLNLMRAKTASPSFVMPAVATGLEFELRVTGRGADPDVNHVNHFFGTDSLKVRHPDAVVTLTGPEPMATTDIVESSIRLVYTYSAAGLYGRVLAGNIEVTAAVDGVAVTPTININGARGEITIVLDWEAYPNPDGHLLAVTLSLGAAADGFVLGEPSSLATPFSFVVIADPSVCDRTPQVRDAIVALAPVSDCADVTNIHLADIGVLDLAGSSIETLQEGDFAGLIALSHLYLNGNELTELPEEVFSGLPTLKFLSLGGNSLAALPADVFAGLPGLLYLYLHNNRLEALPAGVFSALTAVNILSLEGNPGIEGFRPIANAGADQTAGVAQVVTLTATASDEDPWGDNVRYVWTRTDNSGSVLTLMGAETASLGFVMPAGATGLEFELRVTGRGGDHFVGTDSLKVRHPDAVVTLTGAEPAATTDIVENEFSLVFTYSAADLHGRGLADKIEVAAAVDGVAITSDINIDEAKGQGEITVILRRQEYPDPDGYLLAVTLSLSATAEGFVLGETRSITTPFSFRAVVTLTGPEPVATTDIVEDSISLLYTYSAADLHGRILAGKIEVAAAIDGVAITPDINIDEASGQGEITVVLRRQEYPGPIGHLLAVTLSLSAAAEGFVLGEPSSINTPFSFFSSVDPSVCARTEQVRDAIVALVPVSHCADVTDVHLAGINILSLSRSSIETLQEGDFAGLTNLLQLLLSNNSLEALPAGVFSELPTLRFLYLGDNSLTALPADVFADLPAIEGLGLGNNSLEALPAGIFSGLSTLRFLSLDHNSLTVLPAGVFSDLPALELLNLSINSLEALPAGVFSGLPTLRFLYLGGNSLTALPADVFADLPALEALNLSNNSLEALPAGAFSGLPALALLYLNNNSLRSLPGGVFSSLTALSLLTLDGNPGSEGFRPIANAGADQTAGAAQVVTLTATASGDDPWGDNVSYVWTRTDNSGSDLTLMDAETASLGFVMPAGATGLEFELRVTGRGANGVVNHFVGTDSLKVRHPDAVVTLNGPEPAITTNVVGKRISLLYTYSAADLHGRMLAGKIEGTAAVDGVGIILDININEAKGQGEITVVLRRKEYPGPIGHLLAVTLSLSATAEGFVLGEPSSRTTTFSFFSSVDPSVCARTEQVRDALVALVPVSHCANVTDVHLAGIGALNLSGSSIVTLQEGDFAGLTNLSQLSLSSNSLETLPAGIFSGLPTLRYLYLDSNSLTALPGGVFSGLPTLSLLYLNSNSLTALPGGVFAGLTDLHRLYLSDNNLMELSADVFSALPNLQILNLTRNSLTALPKGVFSGLTALNLLTLEGNPGSEGFRPIANAGADQTAGAGLVVTLMATASGDDPWGDNVYYVWTRTDNSGSDLTLMDAETASPSFVMPAGATGLEFELRVTGRGGLLSGNDFVGTDSLKVRHPDAVVTLTGPEPAATTTEIVANEFSLVFTYSAADLHGRVLAGNIEVTAAVDGVAVTPTINIDEAMGQGEITVVLRRQEYPGPIGHLLAVTLRLSATAEGFVLGEPGSMTTTFRFSSYAASSVCARTPQVRDAIVALVPVSHCADVTDVHLAGISDLNLSGSSVETLQEGDFAGLTALRILRLNGNSLTALPEGIFAGLTALETLYLNDNNLMELSADVFSGLSRLQVLNLEDNSLTLTVLPAGVFSELFDLKALFLAGNGLTALSEGVFVGLTALRTLYLDDNSLTVLPEGVFAGLPLKDLYLNDNGLTELPQRVFAGLPLEALYLNDNSLRALPEGVFAGLPALKGLYLDYNSLTALPLGVFAGLPALEDLYLDHNSLTELPLGVFAGLPLEGLYLNDNSLAELPLGVFAGLPLEDLYLHDNNLMELPLGVFAGLPLKDLYLNDNSLMELSADVFSSLTALVFLNLSNNSLAVLSADAFSGLPALALLYLSNNSLTVLPGGVFAGLPALVLLLLDGNPGSEGFRPIANAGADQTAGADQVVTLTATASDADPWGDNVSYAWTRTDNSGSDLTLRRASTASPGFVMPAGATELEFELRVTGRGANGVVNHFVDTDSLKVRHPAVVTLTGPEPVATTDIGGDSISLVYTYSADDLRDRILTGSIKVAAAVDGVAVTPTIKINGASGEITIVLEREAYPSPEERSLAVILSLSAAADGFVLGEPSSITTPFSFLPLPPTRLEVRQAEGNHDKQGTAASDTIELGYSFDYAADNRLNRPRSGLAVQVDFELCPDATASGCSGLALASRIQTLDGSGFLTLKIDRTLAELSVFGEADDDAIRHGRVLLSTAGDESFVATVATTRFSFVVPADPSVCARTPQVRDAIVALVPVSDCAYVTDVHLAGISDLNLSGSSIVALQEGDFAGLTHLSQLQLGNNRLEALPAGVFSELPTLSFLYLDDNSLTALPAGVFSGLTALSVLDLSNNRLEALPAGAFSGLAALGLLILSNNSLTALPGGVFSGLTALETLHLNDNNLMELSADVFSGLTALETLHLNDNNLMELSADVFSGLTALGFLILHHNSLEALPAGAFSGLTALETLHLNDNNLMELSADVFSGLTALGFLILHHNSLEALPAGVFSGLTALETLHLNDNNLMELSADVFSGLTALGLLALGNNSLTALPGGIFSGLTALDILLLDDNPGSEGFRPVADAGADQTAEAAQVVTLTATASGDDPWGDNVRYVWTRTDNSGSDLTLRRASTASPGFVMPAGATELEFELRVTGRGANGVVNHFVGTDSLKVRYLYAVVTLTGPEPVATTDIGGDSISLVYTYSAADLRDRILTGSIKVAAAVDGDAVTPTININGARGEITIVLGREAYPNPDGHLLAVILSLSAAADGFVLGEPSSITTPFSFLPIPPTRLEVRQAEGNHDKQGTAASDTIELGYSFDYAADNRLNRPRSGLAVQVDFELCPDATASGCSGLALASRIQTLDGSGSLTLKIDRTLAELSVFGEADDDAIRHGRVLLSTAGDGSFVATVATTRFSFVVPADPSVCARTPQVRDAIVALVPVSHCADVTDVHLAGISDLNLSGSSVETLQEGDFAGLTALRILRLNGNSLTALPEGIFAGLTALETLYLNDNNLMELSADVFSGLSRLQVLNLEDNSLTLTVLPAGVFSELLDLKALFLAGNGLTALSEGVFAGLTALRSLYLDDNSLTVLPEGVFAGLPLKDLYLNDNGLTELPQRVFAGLPLEALYLNDNSLRALPEGVFAGLPALKGLYLDYNSLTALPLGVFAGLTALEDLYLDHNSLTELPLGVFAGLPLEGLYLNDNSLAELPLGVFAGLPLEDLYLHDNNLMELPLGVFAGLPLKDLYLNDNSLMELSADVFSSLTALVFLNLSNNSLAVLSADAFSGLPALALLYLSNNSLTVLPGGVFAGLPALVLLLLDGNPGSEGFRPIANAGADQTAGADQVVTLTATASDADPWGDNVSYAWRQTDNSGNVLSLMGADTASPGFVMPAGATGLEFELRVTGRGANGVVNHFVGTDSLKVRYLYAVVTLTGPEPVATTDIGGDSISLVYTYSADDLRDRILTGSIKVAAAVDGVAVTPTIKINGASGEITIVLEREAYPSPEERSLAVILSLSAAADGFVLGEPSSITTPFSFLPLPPTRLEVRQAEGNHDKQGTAASDTIELGYSFDYAADNRLNRPRSGLAVQVDFELCPDATASGCSGLALASRIQTLDGSGFLTLKIDRTLAELSVFGEADDDAIRHGRVLLSTAGDESFVATVATTRFSFVVPADPSVCARTPQVRDAIVASVPVSDCAYVTDVHLAGISDLNLSGSSIVALQEGDFAGLTHLSQLQLGNNRLEALPAGVFSGLTALSVLDLSNNRLEALPAGAFSGLAALGLLILSNNSLTALPGGVFSGLTALETLHLNDNNLMELSADVFSGLTALGFLILHHNSLEALPAGAFSGLTALETLHLNDNNLMELSADVFSGLTALGFLILHHNSLEALPAGVFSGLTALETLHLNDNNLMELSADVFSGLTALGLLALGNNSLTALPGGIFSGLTALDILLLDDNPGSEGFRPVADAGADQTAEAAQVVTLTATASGDDPWGDNVRYVWTRTDNSGSDLTLRRASTASPGFVMPAGATELEFELRVTGRGANGVVNHFVGTDSLKVRYLYAVVTLTGPEPVATTDIGGDSISLVYTYSAADLRDRILTGSIKVAAAVDGDAVTPTININGARGEITIVLGREAYPNPDGHLLAVALSLSAEADGFVLGETSSITTPFSFRAVPDTVLTLSGPEQVATTDIVEESISLVYTYSAADLRDRILTGSIKVAAAVDGDAVTPTININGARGEITIVLGREAYPNPDGHLLAVALSLSAAADGFVLGETSSITTPFSFRAVPDTVLTLSGPEQVATTDIVEESISLVYTYSADDLRDRILTGSIKVAAAVDGDAVTPTININGARGEITIVLGREAYPNPDGHLLAVALSLSAAADGFVLGETSSITTPFSFRAVPDTVLTLSGPEQVATTDIVEESISLVYTYSADDLRDRILTGSIKVAAAVDGDAVTPAIYVDETRGRGEITVVLKRESYPAPGSHLLAVALSLSAAADGFVLGETSSITTSFSFRAVPYEEDVPDTVLTLSGPEQVTTTGIVQGYISLLYTFAADNLRGRALTGNFEVTAAVDGVAVTPAIYVDETRGRGEITVVLKRESYPAPGSHSLAVTLSLSAAADGFVLGETSSITTSFSFRAVPYEEDVPDTVLTLSGPEQVTTTGIVQGYISLLYTFAVDNLRGRALTGNFEVTAAVDGVVVAPAIYVDETRGRGEITVVLKRESYPAPGSHLLAVTLSLSAVAADGFALGEISSITTLFSFSILSTAFAEDGTCQLGMLEPGESCRYKGSSMIMSVPQAGSQVLFFELSGRGEPLNLKDASNPDDPDDPNVYNLHAIMMGRGYQIIRIYTSPKDFLKGDLGSMGGAAILWAALFFFADFARGLAGRRSRCPRGRRQEPGNRSWVTGTPHSSSW